MGYRLQNRITALAMAGMLPVSRNAQVVLHGMAQVAMDKHDPPTYWGGWEYLATGWLGYTTYDKAAELAVSRALAELVNAGLVKQVGRHGGARGPRMYVVSVHL